MSIGEKIKLARTKKGLTQTALGHLCGISDSYLRKYESDKIKPKFEMATKIAKALEVPVTYLLNVDDMVSDGIDTLKPLASKLTNSFLDMNVDEAAMMRFQLQGIMQFFILSIRGIDPALKDMADEIDSYFGYMLDKYNLKEAPFSDADTSKLLASLSNLTQVFK
ncbi:MAG: helix-turn-helix domain-containing protein [Defluviitaleaceae bacterium]|nr:helix-turn-helix domain-containing protein [Defluviitaleaceae bacterium]